MTIGGADELKRQPLEVFYKKGVLRNSAKFTEKHLCQSLFFNKFQASRLLGELKIPLSLDCHVNLYIFRSIDEAKRCFDLVDIIIVSD